MTRVSHVPCLPAGKLQLGAGLLLARKAANHTAAEAIGMEVSRQTAVYRVCARDGEWHVYQEPTGEPLASFGHKSAALTYAMGLARGRASWQLLLMSQTDRPQAELRH